MKSLVISLLAVTAVMAQEDCIKDTTAACKFERDKAITRNCENEGEADGDRCFRGVDSSDLLLSSDDCTAAALETMCTTLAEAAPRVKKLTDEEQAEINASISLFKKVKDVNWLSYGAWYDVWAPEDVAAVEAKESGQDSDTNEKASGIRLISSVAVLAVSTMMLH